MKITEEAKQEVKDAILDIGLDELVADGKVIVDENGYYKVNDTDVFKP